MLPCRPPADAAQPVLSEALLRRLDVPGPRYTSYPTADRFVDAHGADAAQRHLAQAAARPDEPLSLYVHIPFCESVCYYCACNKVVTRHHDRAAPYLDALGVEIALVREAMGAARPAARIHFGGGSPTFLSDDEIARVVAMLGAAFAPLPGAGMAIEVDPRTVTPERLARLREIGFDRISFGVQDLDPEVQQAVHRVQPLESVRALVEAARALGFASINTDLIYGLPRQTPERFARTVEQVAQLRPDRIALYAYAHLPERFKPQRRIVSAELPGAGDRVAMLGGAIASFVSHGYRAIGMDHFALPDDELAVAQREGRLQRNFQGYDAEPEGDLLAFGVSAISRIGASYHQNAKTLPEYHAALRGGRLPVVRGLSLDADDLLRRDVIMALMCQGRVGFDAVEARHGVRVRDHFAAEFRDLERHAEDGLLLLAPDEIRVTPAGWAAVRAIAMVFDRSLREGQRRAQFSRIV